MDCVPQRIKSAAHIPVISADQIVQPNAVADDDIIAALAVGPNRVKRRGVERVGTSAADQPVVAAGADQGVVEFRPDQPFVVQQELVERVGRRHAAHRRLALIAQVCRHIKANVDIREAHKVEPVIAKRLV